MADDAESVREMIDAFAFYAGTDGALDGDGLVAAARALGFAPTESESRALVVAVAAFPGRRLDFAGFVSMLGTVVGRRVPRPHACAADMQRGLEALQRIVPMVTREHVSRIAASHGDPLSPYLACELAACDGLDVRKRRLSSQSRAHVVSDLVSDAIARYDKTLPHTR